MTIKLDNGREVVMSIIDVTAEINESTFGTGHVVAKWKDGDRGYVTWRVWKNPDGSGNYLAENGHYELTKKEAEIDMCERHFGVKPSWCGEDENA